MKHIYKATQTNLTFPSCFLWENACIYIKAAVSLIFWKCNFYYFHNHSARHFNIWDVQLELGSSLKAMLLISLILHTLLASPPWPTVYCPLMGSALTVFHVLWLYCIRAAADADISTTTHLPSTLTTMTLHWHVMSISLQGALFSVSRLQTTAAIPVLL